MFRRASNKELDMKNVNDTIFLAKKILNITYFLILIIGFYAIIMLAKELHVLTFVLEVLSIVAPLFVGIFMAWLFDPVVDWLYKKGIRRVLGAIMIYVLFLGGILIVVSSIVPVLMNQINDFAGSIPAVFDSIQVWINEIFDKLNRIQGFDADSVKNDLFARMEEIGLGLTQSIPSMAIGVIKSLFSGIGVFVIGLIIGFYLLVGFDSVDDTIITALPKRLQKDAMELGAKVNSSLRNFVQGALIDCTFVFIISSFGLSLIGLEAPLLFGLFCGLTNIIPYAGPYIGGLPAVIVGFSQGTVTGLLVILVIAIIQFLEGNFLQPIIMSKTTKLHPVTIMLGLLVFGHFWGILGMLISTPIIAACKSVFMYFDEKRNPFDLEDIQEEFYEIKRKTT